MRNFKVTPKQIRKEAPFEFDSLDRAANIQTLTKFLSKINVPFSLAVNGAYGAGKSTFCTMWQKYLEAQDWPTVYFNAWENDFYADPLVPFITEVMSQLKPGVADKDFVDLKKKFFKLLKLAIPMALKHSTMGLVDLGKVTTEELGKLTEAYADNLIKEYDKNKESIQAGKAAVQKLVELYKTADNEPQKSIVIFIDELDRCKPTFSLNLLEIVKHLFNIPGIIFVLPLDKAQISSIITQQYGPTIDAEGYLRRFVDYEFFLPQNASLPFLNNLMTDLGIDQFQPFVRDRHVYEYVVSSFQEWFDILRFSLRKQEQIIAQFSYVLSNFSENSYIYPGLLIMLLIARNLDQKIYVNIIKGETTPKLILKEILKYTNSPLSEDLKILMEAYLVSTWPAYEKRQALIKQYKGQTSDLTENAYNEAVLDRMGRLGERDSSSATTRLYSIIEFSSQLNRG